MRAADMQPAVETLKDKHEAEEKDHIKQKA